MSDGSLFTKLFTFSNGSSDRSDLLYRLEKGLATIRSNMTYYESKIRKCHNLENLEDKRMKLALKQKKENRAKSYATKIGKCRLNIQKYEKLYAKFEKIAEVFETARNEIIMGASMHDALEIIKDANSIMGREGSMKLLPLAMREGQLLKTMIDQTSEVTDELSEALEMSDDDEWEEQQERESEDILESNPSKVFTTTNPKAILEHARVEHNLLATDRYATLPSVRGHATPKSDNSATYGFVDYGFGQ